MLLQKVLIMERINRSDDIALVSSSLGKGEAVALTGHRRAGKTLLTQADRWLARNNDMMDFMEESRRVNQWG